MWGYCLRWYEQQQEQMIETYWKDFIVIFRQESHINGITRTSAYVFVKLELPRQ